MWRLLSFKDHVSQTTRTKCNNLVYVLRKIRRLITCEEAKLIYTSIIRPKIEHCCSLFLEVSSTLSRKIESVQNKAIRAICNAPRKFSVTNGRRLLNLHTLCSRRFYFFRNLVHKVQCGLASSELYQLIENVSSHQMKLRFSCRHILPSVNTNNGIQLLRSSSSSGR